MKGGYPPLPSVFDRLPYRLGEWLWSYFFFKMKKDGVTIT